MAEDPDPQHVLAAAVVTLLQSGADALAAVLLTCKLVYWVKKDSDTFSALGIEGMNLGPLRGAGSLDRESLKPEVYRALKDAGSPFWNLQNVDALARGASIRLETAVVSAEYQAATRTLVEQALGASAPVGGLRVRQEGKVVDIKPISIYPTGTFDRDPRLCFVMMPFATGFQEVYERGIKRAIESQGLTCRRGDDILQSGDILAQIWKSLIQARIVVADLTGANGNVLYELGLAHMMGHQAILLAQNLAVVPFDLRQQRHIIYSTTADGIQRLVGDLGNAIKGALAQ